MNKFIFIVSVFVLATAEPTPLVLWHGMGEQYQDKKCKGTGRPI